MKRDLPRVGELVAGRYRILEEIGSGGYGVVYRARQDAMGRDVALKVLKPDAAENEVEVERFRREVFHASGLRHPNTIKLYDFGELGGLFYIVMEFLEGLNLRERVMRDGPMDEEEALDAAEQILRSLQEAHEHGIVHRDLKPENIFLTQLGGEQMVKVLDFGLSKYVEDSPEKEATLTKDGVIFGTPQYMSPEQAYGNPISPATDIYAVGLLTFEMLTARSAFSGRSSMEILIKQVSQPLPSLPERFIGTVVAEFMTICTQKELEQRFSHAGEALEWLQQRRSEDSVLNVFEAPEFAEAELEEESSDGEIDTEEEPIDELSMRVAQLPLFGREETLDELMRWSREALSGGGIAWITGELGIGKSRLVDEWTRHLQMDGVLVFRGRYREAGSALEGLREAMAPLVEKEVDSPQTLPAVLSVDRIRELRHILRTEVDDSEDEPEEVGQNRRFACLEQTIYAISSARPTVVVLDDLHWADSFTLRLLEHWQEELTTRSIPLLLILSSRTDEMGRADNLNYLSGLGTRYESVSFAQSIQLQRLSDDESRRLLRYLMPLGDEVVDYVCGLARGNPLYLTETLRFLVEEELIGHDEDDDEWSFVSGTPPRERQVPPSLRSMLSRRIKNLVTSHRLGAVLRAVLGRATLLGNRFELRLLKSLLDAEGRDDLKSYLDDALEVLARASILVPTIIDGRPGVEFAYNLLREVLQESEVAAADELRELHGHVAETKIAFHESRDEEPSGDTAAAIARHLRGAGEDKEGFKWLMRAADDAARAQDFRGALLRYRDAESLLDDVIDPSGEYLLDIRLAQGRLHRYLGEFGPAQFALEAALDEAEKVGDLVGQALAGEALADVAKLLGDHEEARILYQATSELNAGFPDAAGEVRCEIGLAEIDRYQGHYRDAEKRFRDAFEHAGEASPQVAIRCLLGLGMCSYAGGRLQEAEDQYRRARKRAESVGDARLMSSADTELAMLAIHTRGIHIAEELANRALDTKRSLGDMLGQANAHIILGMCLRRSTRVSKAVYHTRRALTLHERLGHTYGLGKCILLEAEIAWVQGRLADAIERVQDARKLHEEINDSHGLALSCMYEALFRLDAGQHEDARHLLERAMELGEGEGLGLYDPHCLLFMGMVFEAEANLEEAVYYYGEALERSERMGNRETASLAATSLAKCHLIFGDVEGTKEDIPIARHQAEILGNNIAMLFALTGEAWLARMTGNANALQTCLQKLRVLNDPRTGMNLRIPERMMALGRLVRQHQPNERGAKAVRAIIEILQAIGADESASTLRQTLGAG